MKEKDRYQIKLLPNYFKYIDLGIIALDLTFAVVSLYLNDKSLLELNYLMLKSWYGNFIILGLFFYAFSKEKIEDERIAIVRYKSITYAFYSFIVFFFGLILLPSLSGNPDFQYDGRMLIAVMLLIFIVAFLINKRKQLIIR